MSADPLFVEGMDELGLETQKVNLYSYVENNPLKFTDPTGEHPVLIGLAYAGAVNATAMIGAWGLGATAIKGHEAVTGNSGAQNMDNLNKAINVGMAAGFTPAVGAAAVVGTTAIGSAAVNAASSAYGTASVWAANNPVGADIALGVGAVILERVTGETTGTLTSSSSLGNFVEVSLQAVGQIYDKQFNSDASSQGNSETSLTIENSNFQSREAAR